MRTAGLPGMLPEPRKYWWSRASLSDCGNYRYGLVRIWRNGDPLVTWCMLNPSKADAEMDDATIRKCVGFSRRWNFGGIQAINLFGLRATDPTELLVPGRDIQGLNLAALAGFSGRRLVVAWGSHATKVPGYDKALAALLDGVDLGNVWCLGTTKSGQPRHPCRLGYDTELARWRRG